MEANISNLNRVTGDPLIKVDIIGFGLAFGIFMDYRYGPWVFRIEVFGTESKQDSINFE